MTSTTPAIVFAATIMLGAMCGILQAQTLTQASPFSPVSPTSASDLQFRIISTNPQCSFIGSVESLYRLKMENNHITLTFKIPWSPPGQTILGPEKPSPPVSIIDAYIGRLPPGDYKLTTIGAQCPTVNLTGEGFAPEYKDYPFTVTDARVGKPFPFVSLDFSGHWVDPNEPGSALYVSHDDRNNILATWLTFNADGSAAWYVFQPRFVTWALTFTADLWQASKPPSLTAPASGETNLRKVGTASLNFLPVDSSQSKETLASILYQFGNEPLQQKTLVRFKRN